MTGGTPEGPLPLDLGPEAASALLRRIVDEAVRFLEDLPRQPVSGTEDADAVAATFGEPPPEEGGPLEPLLQRLREEILPCALNTASGGYLAYVPGGGLVSAAAADLLASITNRYAGIWAAAPGAVELETEVLRWLAAALGFPRGTLGVMTTGGSMSNLIAAVTAREKLLADDPSRGVAYVSEEVHGCVAKGLRIAGIPAARLRRIPVDARQALRVDLLAERIAADRAAGARPFFVVGSAGTVNTGAVDPLAAIASLARKEGLWFHVDGAYGATFGLVPELRPVLAGMAEADSLALDPHKGLFLAYGTGVLLVRDMEALRRAHAGEGAYLPEKQDPRERLDFCDLSPELSRDWRGLRLWLPLELHGLAAFREALAGKHHLARRAWEALAAHPELELTDRPALSLFAFRRRGRSPEAADEATRRLLREICRPRRVLVTGTTMAGAEWIRVCVLHLRTGAAEVETLIGEVARALGRPS